MSCKVRVLPKKEMKICCALASVDSDFTISVIHTNAIIIMVAPPMTFLLPYQPTKYPVAWSPRISPMYAPLVMALCQGAVMDGAPSTTWFPKVLLKDGKPRYEPICSSQHDATSSAGLRWVTSKVSYPSMITADDSRILHMMALGYALRACRSVKLCSLAVAF